MRPVALFDCHLDLASIAAATHVLGGTQLAAGTAVRELENRLSGRLGGRHVVSMSDMTHALMLALRLVCVGTGDEVLTLSYNCMSSNSAISLVGATPVWVDIEPGTATMSVSDCAAALTPKTKALVVYHVAGYPAPIRMLREFCDAHGLALIEDANNALGATVDGQPVGTFGDFAVFSFYANRQVNGIDGAALVCRDDRAYREALKLRRFGIDTSTFRDAVGEIDGASDIARIGDSASLNNVQATLALAGLETLDARLARNRENVAALTRSLADVTEIRPVVWNAENSPAFWAWLVQCDSRDELLPELKRRGIACSKLHHPNHAYSGFASNARALPGTEAFIQTVLALPCGWWLDEEDLERIYDSVRAAVGALAVTQRPL